MFIHAIDDVWREYMDGRQQELMDVITENPDASLDFIAICALLGQLRLLASHTSSLAWRVAHILQKEQPQFALLPEPQDLYQFDIET